MKDLKEYEIFYKKVIILVKYSRWWRLNSSKTEEVWSLNTEAIWCKLQNYLISWPNSKNNCIAYTFVCIPIWGRWYCKSDSYGVLDALNSIRHTFCYFKIAHLVVGTSSLLNRWGFFIQ